MTDLQGNQLSEKVDSLWKFSGNLSQAIGLLRLIGYGLLALAFLDLLQIFASPQFRNPTWEFELIGQLVERVAVPLIGLGFVFMGQQLNRQKRERLILKILSWLMLLVSILFLALIPLNIVSLIRIDRQSNEQLTAQVKQATEQLQEAKSQVSGITTIKQAEIFLSNLDPQNRVAEIQNSQSIDEIKEKLSLSLSSGERQLRTQAKISKNRKYRVLLKNSVKWNIGALLSAALFLSIWKSTAWSRSKKKAS